MSYGKSWETDDKSLARNPWPLIILASCFVIVLALRLFSLQVLQYNRFFSKSVSIRIKPETIEAPRGFIYDRNGEILSENQMSYSITVDPYDEEALAEAMRRVLADPDLAEDLRQQGLERAAGFTWEQTARKTVQVYQEVLS